LFGENNRRTGLHSLILTLQARYDVSEAEGSIGGYSQHVIPVRWYYWDPDTGFDFVVNDRFWRTRTIDPNLVTARDGRLSPRIGFQYQPNAGLTLRAAWRRSFKAPVWSDQFSPRDEGNPSIYASGWRGKVIDPYDPDGPTEITQDLGVTQVFVPSNPEIESEYSDYWSLDFEWAPESLPGLRWSMEWSLVDVSNRVRSSSAWFYNNPEWILNHPHVAVRNERGDLVQVKSIDINIAADYNEIVTGELEYSFDTRFGTFTPRVGYTRYLDDYTQVVDEAPRDENIGTQNGLDEYKWQGSVTWLWGRFAADIYAYYTPGYVNTRALQCNFARFNIPGSRCTRSSGYLTLPVSSLTTVDMTVTYLFDNGLRLRAGGTNILSRAAPITLSFSGSSACCGFSQGLQVPYDPTRWDARGRVFFMELNWEM